MPAGPLVDAEELVFAHSVPEGGFRESALLMNGQVCEGQCDRAGVTFLHGNRQMFPAVGATLLPW
jgi:hypothetical protein